MKIYEQHFKLSLIGLSLVFSSVLLLGSGAALLLSDHKKPYIAPPRSVETHVLKSMTSTPKAITAPGATKSVNNIPSKSPTPAVNSFPALTNAQTDAAYCGVVELPLENNEQDSLDSSRSTNVTNVFNAINNYNSGLETAAFINQLIEQANSSLAQVYQQYLSGNNPSIVKYGCQQTLTPETPLPDFEPTSTWNP